jgi:hypothetical protein
LNSFPAVKVLCIPIATFLLSCGGEIDPDEIVIRAADLISTPVIDPVVQPVDTTLFQPDTITMLPESLLIAQFDSTAADSTLDSLTAISDSLQMAVWTADTLASPYSLLAIEINGSLYSSIGSVAGIEADVLGAHFVRCMWWDLNPWRDLIAGDSLYALYDTLGTGLRENSVVCLRYVPVSGSSCHPFTVYTFFRTGDNFPSIWYSGGDEVISILNRMPLSTFEEITGIYGEPREGHIHAGVDYKAPEGTPVRTVMGGTVSRTNWNTVYNGYCVEIDFGGYSEIFLHLEGIAPGVVPGARLSSGDRIGTVGNTGRSYSPHLHYQINDPSGNSIDPYLYFNSHRRLLEGSDIASFSEWRERCDRWLVGGSTE